MTLSSKPHIGFIGLGAMGLPMATNILKAQYPLNIWNRNAARMHSLVELGAKPMPGAAHVAAESEIIITMLADPQAVEQVVLGPDGVADGLKPGSVLIDMSTVDPTTSRKLAGALAAKQAEFMDAPVAGSIGPAAEGTLVIMVGALPQTLERSRSVLDVLGRPVLHVGAIGMGSTMKLAVNLMLAHLTAGIAEALLLLDRSGANAQQYLDILSASAFQSPWYQSKGKRMLQRDFAPRFALKHMHKDLRLMLGLAAETGSTLPITERIRDLFADSEQAGRGELDYSSILAVLEQVSDLRGTEQ